MNSTLGLAAIAIIGGCAVALQGQFMGMMDRKIGTSGSLFINYLSGFLIASLVLFLTQSDNLKNISQIPWYAFTVGLLGLIIAGSIGYSVPRIGLSTTLTIIVASQFIVAMILEHYGIFSDVRKPVDPWRLSGACGLIISVWLLTNNTISK
ncbi:MAG: DMT family transporter [Pseudomonadota bacterium]